MCRLCISQVTLSSLHLTCSVLARPQQDSIAAVACQDVVAHRNHVLNQTCISMFMFTHYLKRDAGL